MRWTKACLMTAVLGVASAPALADYNLFIAPDGSEAAGNQTLFLNAGESIPLSVWIEDLDQVDLLNFYQVGIFMDASGGAGGSVNFALGSLVQDQARADWVLAGGPSTNLPTNLENAAVGQRCFSSIGGFVSLTAGITVPAGTPKYLQEFVLETTTDACGTWTLDFIQPGGPCQGGTSIGDNMGQPFGTAGLVPVGNFQTLTIVVGPQNDDCADAQVVGNGDTDFSTLCATTDGADHAGTGCDNAGQTNVNNDIWFSYTATCQGDLTVSTCNNADFDTRIAVYNDGVGCTPGTGDLAGCNDDGVGCALFTSEVTVPVALGGTYLIRVGGFGPSTAGSGTLNIDCAADCLVNADCDDGNPCTTDVCAGLAGCVYTNNTNLCNDGDPCTLTDACSAGACVGSNINTCNDFSPCTVDSCDASDPGAAANGCLNADIAGLACADDTDCDNPTEGDGGPGSCNLGIGLCECQAGNNLNPQNSLCFDIRFAGGVAAGSCSSADSDCGPSPDGVLQCSDDDGNPLNGGVCVDQACYDPADQITVDIELGPTAEPVCGTQLFLGMDASCMMLAGVELDPDGELGWSQVFVNGSVDGPGTYDIVMGTPIGAACNAGNGSTAGGTIARLTFNTTSTCKCGGVYLRPHNPVSGVGGANGAINLVTCNGTFSTDEIQIQGAPTLSCNGDDVGQADCGGITRSVSVDPVVLEDDCDDLSAIGSADICTVSYHQACGTDLDCGFSPADLCANDAECGGGAGDCVADATADGFVCAGNQPCIGFCRQDTCSGGFCDNGTVLTGAEADAILGGGDLTLLPGAIDVACSYTNGCGRTADCSYRLGNDGLNKAIIDVELSPTMVAGTPANPIVRCIHFELSACGATGDPLGVDAEVTFGAPEHIPGHGSACIKVPAGNWDCLTAADPKHSLTSTCTIECNEDGVLYAQFKGSKDLNDTCAWLTQGNLNWPSPNIDIFDYTILAGQYLTLAPNGNDSPCGAAGFDADLNGDGLVTLADFSFVVANFFCASKDPCSVLCNPGADGLAAGSTKAAAPRSSVTIAELEAAGLGEFAAAADVNADGVVDLTDMAGFIATNADEDPVLAADLSDKTEKLQKSHRTRTRKVGTRR